MNRATKLGISATTLMLMASNASAQAAPALGVADSPSRSKVLMEEVLVTARKRQGAEVAQDVPAAITAFSGDQIENAFLRDLTEVGHLVPNAEFHPSSFPGYSNFMIRGLAVAGTVLSDEPAVGVFIDGMYLGTNAGMVVDTFDLDAVEVLRGPQSTLFGRNVVGGAIQLRARRPTGKFGYRAQAALGSNDHSEFSGSIEGPLVTDKLSPKLAVHYINHDGYYDNRFRPGDDNRIGWEETYTIRPSLLFTPTPAVDVYMLAEVGNSRFGPAPTRSRSNPGLVTTGLGYVEDPDPQVLEHNLTTHGDMDYWHGIVDIEWRVGPGALRSITTYRDFKQDFPTDVDGTRFTVLHFEKANLDQDQVSQELRYAADFTSNLNATLGVYYFSQDYVYTEDRDFSDFAPIGTVLYGKAFIDQDSYAAFAQLAYKAADKLTITGGLRYSYEKKEARIASIGQCSSLRVSDCTFGFTGDNSWADLSWHAGLEYEVSNNARLYASATRGFRSGGFNVRNPAGADASYDPESVIAYEVGLKSELLDNRLRLNVAGFFNDYDDMQRTVLDARAVQRTLNAGKAEITGVEIEAIAQVMEALTINAAIGLLHNDIIEFDGLDVNGDGIPDPALAADRELTDVPDYSFSLGATYSQPVGNRGELLLQINWDGIGSRPADDTNTVFIPQRRFLDASVSWFFNDGLSLSVYGKNLTDKTAAAVVGANRLFVNEWLLPPRTWGVQLTYEY